jgi:D-glycero-alpha-D-manno-heptose 1-phosphate guanylyltransferase
MPETPDVVILCGGAGSRLKSITGDTPKPMAAVAGRPFLELLLQQLRRHGFQRVILASGYQKEAIREYFDEHNCGLQLIHSCEPVPLGTGGALKHAENQIQSHVALIMNGDSYTDIDLSDFVAKHRETGADVSMAVVAYDGRRDCGLVSIAPDGAVEDFSRNVLANDLRYVNAGIYATSATLLCGIPDGVKISLEEQLLPTWIRQNNSVRAYITPGPCVDIGTPDRYSIAQTLLASAESLSTATLPAK